jgi:hypothetical protein
MGAIAIRVATAMGTPSPHHINLGLVPRLVATEALTMSEFSISILAVVPHTTAKEVISYTSRVFRRAPITSGRVVE